jgi:hypothetical protein
VTVAAAWCAHTESREHHRLTELGGWTIHIDGATVTFTHPDGRELISTRGDP